MAKDVFSVPVFLVVFRETLETVIIVSVLLAFLKQTLDGSEPHAKTYKALRRQVWLGVAAGLLVCIIVAASLIGVFYTVGSNAWEANENYYEGAFCLLAAAIITVMGAALLRIGKMQSKWRVKLARAMESPVKAGGTRGTRGCFAHWLEKYAMFVLPFITVLREGIEAVVFVAGVTFSAPARAVPLPVCVGLVVGGLIGWILYKGGSTARLRMFLAASTYLVAAGLFSRGVWSLEAQKWNIAIGGDAAETGSGPGSYDIDNSVWHVNCCSPTAADNGGWGVFNAILGWQNSATYGSVISYNVYWIFVMAGFCIMRFKETKGHYPFVKPKTAAPSVNSLSSSSSQQAVDADKTARVKIAGAPGA